MRREEAVVVYPPAKINLTLRVGSRRPDGFHDVGTLLQTISLCDRMTMARRRGAMVLTTTSPEVPADRTNLVWRAVALVWRAMGRRGEPRGLHVDLWKRIPVAAGLGGGSADAAAALVAANRIFGAKIERAALLRMAAALGSDVPFFLVGGTAFGSGRGEDVMPLHDIRPLDVVVLKPAFGVSAADAYRWFDRQDGGGAASRTAIDVGWPSGPVRLVNDLERPVASRHAEIPRMIGRLTRAGALGAAMSGSGSAVYGVFARGAGRQAAAGLSGSGWQVFHAGTLGRRAASRRVGL